MKLRSRAIILLLISLSINNLHAQIKKEILLEEVLSFGGPDQDIICKWAGLCTDDSNNIYITDISDCAIKKFNCKGEFRFDPGEQEVCWDGRDDQGRPLPGGVYFFSVENGREIMGVRKMVKCE
jgi:hypothetical protein